MVQIKHPAFASKYFCAIFFRAMHQQKKISAEVQKNWREQPTSNTTQWFTQEKTI